MAARTVELKAETTGLVRLQKFTQPMNRPARVWRASAAILKVSPYNVL
jgi:hypothetical protein